MLKRLAVLILTIAFFGILLQSQLNLKLHVALFFVLAFLTATVNYFLHKKEIRVNLDLTFLILPTCWIFSGMVIVFLLNSQIWQFFFSIIMTLLFARLEMFILPKMNSAFVDNLFFFSTIVIFLGIWAGEFFFTPAWWLIIVGIFLLSFVFFWTGFYNSQAGLLEKLLYSLIFSYLMAQISWTLLFWPLHYLSITVTFSSTFYLLWMLGKLRLQGLLTRHTILYHFGFSAVIILITMVTAEWLPNI